MTYFIDTLFLTK